MEEFDKMKLIVGHNIIGFDLPVLKKLFKWAPKKGTKLHDTMIMSQILNYKRFGADGHGLARWGEFLCCPKLEFEDFSQYSEEMWIYWQQDLVLTTKVYKCLFSEFTTLFERRPQIADYMLAEHATSKWCTDAEIGGWPFNREAGNALFELMEAEMNAVRDKLLPRLGSKTIAVDKKLGVVEPKIPKWIKNGDYNLHTANWFGILPETGQDLNRLVEGEYSRVTFEMLDLDSVADVKIFLFRNGWVPTEWNTKQEPIEGSERTRKVKTSPKITEDSLECMDGDGKMYCDFLTTKSRHGLLKGWLANCDSEGMLHGKCFTIGTPSMRATHTTIVNVPSADSVWGKEMRGLFGCLPGWKLIGCDSAGNQARGLAHYLKSPEFTHQLLHGDIHQYNANALTAVLKEMGIDYVVPRSAAKRILYAFLFGASGDKLWSYIFGKIDSEKGKRLKLGFTKAVPGFKTLVEKLEAMFAKTRQFGNAGYIEGIAGNKIYCDSFHKLLVYLLQACEKATCAGACMLLMQYLEEEGIPYRPLIFMHDELDFMVPEEHAERAKELGVKAFQEGPKLFGVTIMDGGGKIGKDWYEIH
jgi:hypothetical protein